MILKNVFGKTIEAAKKTAQQMYGEDVLVIESSEGDGADKKASITIFSDEKKEAKGQKKQAPQAKKATHKPQKEGVKFERSQPAALPSSQEKPKRKDTLSSLRKFAEQQVNGNSDLFTNGNAESNGISNKNTQEESASKKENTSGFLYNRSAVRTQNGAASEKAEAPAEQQPKANKATENKFISHFKPSKPKESQPSTIAVAASASSRQSQREIKALHKRFDKLEALLGSSLMSANLDYASHPAFQQLVKTGINTSAVAGWFSSIIKQGIDPYDQNELFMANLAKLIRKALGNEPEGDPQKFLLFAGPSGAGKTQLIMKLTRDPDFMLNKKVAVLAVYPQNESAEDYYTILEPFCAKHELAYFPIKTSADVNEISGKLEEFDYVLIDTPSLHLEQEFAFREFWKVRQLLSPFTPMEVHYVVNAAMNRFYFKGSSASQHPLQPDYVAVTHLDEISKWGPILPFMQKLKCSARYLSKGDALTNSLQSFNPQWFAQQILQDR